MKFIDLLRVRVSEIEGGMEMERSFLYCLTPEIATQPTLGLAEGAGNSIWSHT